MTDCPNWRFRIGLGPNGFGDGRKGTTKGGVTCRKNLWMTVFGAGHDQVQQCRFDYYRTGKYLLGKESFFVIGITEKG